MRRRPGSSAPPRRSGVVRGRDGGLRAWCLDSHGRRSGQGPPARIVGYPSPRCRGSAAVWTAALLRLARSVLIEQHDEWEASERRYFSTASMLALATMNNPADTLHEAVILPELAA